MALLEVENLSVDFRNGAQVTNAVKNVSFSIEKGEVLAVVGESGSGKSVTALSVLQLLPYPIAQHPSGSIKFKGSAALIAGVPIHPGARLLLPRGSFALLRGARSAAKRRAGFRRGRSMRRTTLRCRE